MHSIHIRRQLKKKCLARNQNFHYLHKKRKKKSKNNTFNAKLSCILFCPMQIAISNSKRDTMVGCVYQWVIFVFFWYSTRIAIFSFLENATHTPYYLSTIIFILDWFIGQCSYQYICKCISRGRERKRYTYILYVHSLEQGTCGSGDGQTK